MQSTGPVLELRSVNKTYGFKNRPKVRALQGISFMVGKGKAVALLGPNGAGKTTLAKIITGITTFDSGEVNVLGYSMPKQRSRILKSTGVILEGDRNFYQYLSASQNMMYFGGLKLLKRREIVEGQERLLKELGLYERRGDRVADYSLGMKRKLGLALALLGDPEFLMLDEPTLGLDVHTRNYLIDKLVSIKNAGKTILLCTHQMEVAERVADEIIVINRGSLIALDKTEAIINRFSLKIYRFTFRRKTTVGASKLAEGDDDYFAFKNALTELKSRYPNIGLNAKDDQVLECELALKREQDIYDFIKYFDERGFVISGLSALEPNLEEAYLKLTAAASTAVTS